MLYNSNYHCNVRGSGPLFWTFAVLPANMHPEDLKAAIRKRFGTIGAFQHAYDLPKTGFTDFLRGRTSRRVEDAIHSALTEVPSKSIKPDNSRPKRAAHRLNEVAS